MKTTLNWLLVGTGDIARKRVAPALDQVSGSRIAAVCSRSEERGRAFASEYGACRVYTDYGEALTDPSVDAVYLATPVFLHTPGVIAAVRAGRHVLVEKPLALDGEDARPAVEAASRGDLACGCAFYRRFYSRFEALGEMIANGELGRIVLVRLASCTLFNPAPDNPKYWRVFRNKSGGGPIADFGSHMFDLLIGLLGLPEAVTGMTVTLENDGDAEDGSAITMRMPGGALATASFHWSSGNVLSLFEITGTKGRVRWEPMDGDSVVVNFGRESRELSMPNHENVHVPLVEDFVRAVREGGQPRVTIAEAAKTNRLIDAVYRASAQQREIPV